MPRKKFRVALLLALLALAYWTMAMAQPVPPPDWDHPLRAVIYPHNSEGSAEVREYIGELTREEFQPIARYLAREAASYPVAISKPIELELGPEISDAPSPPPDSGGFLARVRWGLATRWWHFRFRDKVNRPDIIVIARFHDPAELPEHLHSIGIAAQRLAVAKLVADDSAENYNHVILAHEILHTIGASDLYADATGLPRHPEGYAQPDATPLYPQVEAELMAVRIPLGPTQAREARNLQETQIGRHTAREIGWLNTNGSAQ